MSVAVLVLGAGRGERLGGTVPKAFVPLLGKPLVARSVETAAAVSEVDFVIPVLSEDDQDRFSALRLDCDKLTGPVVGGAERQDSVSAGLEALPPGVEVVAVHDAARCLVSVEDFAQVVAEGRSTGAALLAHPVRDTIKRVRGDEVVDTPSRDECWVALTPQVFRLEILREAMAKAQAEGFIGTDDAQLVERLGVPVRVVPGDPRNIKITHPGDLAVAEALLGRGESEERGA